MSSFAFYQALDCPENKVGGKTDMLNKKDKNIDLVLNSLITCGLYSITWAFCVIGKGTKGCVGTLFFRDDLLWDRVTWTGDACPSLASAVAVL